MKFKDITINSKTYKSVREACKAFNISPAAVYMRMANKGMTVEEAIAAKKTNKGVRVDHLGKKWPSQIAMAAGWGIDDHLFCQRFRVRGWSLKKALTTPPHTRGGKFKVTEQANYKELIEEVRRLRTQLDVFENELKGVWGADIKRTYTLIQKVQDAEVGVSTACSYASFLANEVSKF